MNRTYLNLLKHNMLSLTTYKLVVLASVILLSSCAAIKPLTSTKKINKLKGLNNICHVLKRNPNWYAKTKLSAKKWDIPPYVILAIIKQESSFNSEARPLNMNKYANKKYLSSAYGYAQAINGTWKKYKKDTNNIYAKRNNFADSVDFIGWYIHQSNIKNNTSKHRADLHYLNYHEGWYGYKKKSYLQKRWLLKIAQKVHYQSVYYKIQLNNCLQSSGYKDVVKNIRPEGAWF